jgi:hypothetical protein
MERENGQTGLTESENNTNVDGGSKNKKDEFLPCEPIIHLGPTGMFFRKIFWGAFAGAAISFAAGMPPNGIMLFSAITAIILPAMVDAVD